MIPDAVSRSAQIDSDVGLFRLFKGGSMDLRIRKFFRCFFLSITLIAGFAFSQPLTVTHAQTKAADSSAAVTAEQQKQLNHLQQLDEQIQRDRDAVRSAVTQYSWDSDEADAAQQRLFQDRQQYRQLRRSLQQAGVSVPPDATHPVKSSPSSQSGHCGHHMSGHHGCCGGDSHCTEHDTDCCCGDHAR